LKSSIAAIDPTALIALSICTCGITKDETIRCARRQITRTQPTFFFCKRGKANHEEEKDSMKWKEAFHLVSRSFSVFFLLFLMLKHRARLPKAK
jgi:hypothetical protein